MGRLSGGKTSLQAVCNCTSTSLEARLALQVPSFDLFAVLCLQHRACDALLSSLFRMILSELESQEKSYVEAMQTLLQDYLLPLEHANPRIVSCEMVFVKLLLLQSNFVNLTKILVKSSSMIISCPLSRLAPESSPMKWYSSTYVNFCYT